MEKGSRFQAGSARWHGLFLRRSVAVAPRRPDRAVVRLSSKKARQLEQARAPTSRLPASAEKSRRKNSPGQTEESRSSRAIAGEAKQAAFESGEKTRIEKTGRQARTQAVGSAGPGVSGSRRSVSRGQASRCHVCVVRATYHRRAP